MGKFVTWRKNEFTHGRRFDARYIFKKEIWVQDLEKGSILVYIGLKRGRM